MVEEGKQRLLEVQEVIAEREYRVGRFYFLRQSYPASIARLRSLIDKYPLYSKADEALFLLGQAYEAEIAIVRSKPGKETDKTRLIDDFTKNAADAYSRILTRYPLMDRTLDAKARLEALHQPIPGPPRRRSPKTRRKKIAAGKPARLQSDGELPEAPGCVPGGESRGSHVGGSGSGERDHGGAGGDPSHDGQRGPGR